MSRFRATRGATDYSPGYDPTDNIYAAGRGIGLGLAMAIGVAIARPDEPVLAMVGDGGLAVHLGGLAVLAGERPHVVLVVFNDGGYGVLRNMQRAKKSPARAVDLATPHLDALAAAYRLPHVAVGSARTFDKALAKAVEREGPSIIEVEVAALRARPAPFVPPVEVR